MASTACRQALEEGLGELALAIDSQGREQLLAYLDLLGKWNRAYNLTAVREPLAMVSRHLLDSLSISPWVDRGPVLDVGSGAGLPGIPLAIAHPDRAFTLLDTNGKKTRFLEQCRLQLGLPNLRVLHARVEHLEQPGGFPLITARAFTALPNLVEWCGDLLAPDGRFLAMKGTRPDAELAALPAAWQAVEEISLQVPGCEGERHLLIIQR